jgi:hypothetical protein
MAVQSRPAIAATAAAVARFAGWASLAIGIIILPVRSRNKLGRRRGCALLLSLMFGVSCGGSSHAVNKGGGSAPTTFVVSVQAASDNVVQSVGDITVTVP